MITKLIIFLIRIKLGLKQNELFRFDNQKSKKDEYYFDSKRLMKIEYKKDHVDLHESSVSLNWLLNDSCKIHKVTPEPVDVTCQSA